MSICDHQSVGVIVTDPDGNYLLLHRAKPPVGIAPVAGHVDQHSGERQAALAEAQEEASLLLGEDLKLVDSGYLPNRCRRTPANPDRPGHFWWIYEAEVGADTPLAWSKDETRGGAWYTPARLQELADRTAAYARSEIPESEWQQQPGLEPVWAVWLNRLDHIELRLRDLASISDLMRADPR